MDEEHLLISEHLTQLVLQQLMHAGLILLVHVIMLFEVCSDPNLFISAKISDHNNGQFKWCPNRFNVLINPNPGAAAFKSPSGGSQVSVGSIYCTGFCVT